MSTFRPNPIETGMGFSVTEQRVLHAVRTRWWAKLLFVAVVYGAPIAYLSWLAYTLCTMVK